MFLTVCMNPTLQKTLRFSEVAVDTVNRARAHRLDASGKGVNVSRVLSQLEKPCLHLTQLGGPLRALFLDLCREDRIDLQWVESESAIRFCYTVISDADRAVTELVEEAEPVADGTGGRLMAAYLRALGGAEWVIISGTKADGFPPDIVPEMTRSAKEAGKKVILDLRGDDLTRSLPYKPDVIKPNLLEFSRTFAPDLATGGQAPDIAFDSVSDSVFKDRIRGLCLEVSSAYRCKVVLTRGAESVWSAEDGRFSETAVEPVPPVNTTGSGDAFTAGLAAALSEGADLACGIACGIACGARNAGLFKVGVIRD